MIGKALTFWGSDNTRLVGVLRWELLRNGQINFTHVSGAVAFVHAGNIISWTDKTDALCSILDRIGLVYSIKLITENNGLESYEVRLIHYSTQGTVDKRDLSVINMLRWELQNV
jgi:hypothetical protein